MLESEILLTKTICTVYNHPGDWRLRAVKLLSRLKFILGAYFEMPFELADFVSDRNLTPKSSLTIAKAHKFTGRRKVHQC